ncbi:cellulose synthase subunit BcsC-related outer membrane protein [Termitidicoccus mucosus]|uniref:Cellulose synthase n=1 Tax=Termitidicoccus mucosus TaxID=1184151 RepID=A0A178IGN0_9BACT|nr:cellulose synthase [Opitutaceae bacterium TSB47]
MSSTRPVFLSLVFLALPAALPPSAYAGAFDDSAAPFTGDVRRGTAGLAIAPRMPATSRHAVALFDDPDPPISVAAVPAAPAATIAPAGPTAPPPPTPTPPAQPAPPPSVSEILENGSNAELAALGNEAHARRDASLAEAIAWAWYRRSDHAPASLWFAQAAAWGAGGDDIPYGRAVAALGEDRPDLARQHLAPLVRRGVEKALVLNADLNARLASEAYEGGRYPDTIALLNQVYRQRYLSHREQILLAWSYLRTGDAAKSASIFEGLYRACKDQASADGLVTAVLALPAPPGAEPPLARLYRLGATVGGPLNGNPAIIAAAPPVAVEAAAARAANQGRHVAALAAIKDSRKRGESLPAVTATLADRLSGLASPAFTLSGAYSSKSGTEGLGQLSISDLSFFNARAIIAGRHEISFRASHVRLKTGMPEASEYNPIGIPPVIPPRDYSDPVIPEYPDFNQKPTDHVYDYDTAFSWRYHGGNWSPWFVFGAAPEGIRKRNYNVQAGITYVGDDNAMFEAAIFDLPVKDSLLSYTGIRDPWTGASWGQVMTTGARLVASRPLENDWAIRAEGHASQLTGDHVETNYGLGFNLGLRKNLPPDLLPLGELAYLTIGPDVSFLHYEKNLGKFTWGHGGYFSPEYLFQADIGANLLTREDTFWLAKIDALLGYQANEQAGAPYYPGLSSAENLRYPGTTTSGLIFSLRARAAFMLSPHWMVGGFIDANKTADYNAYGIGMHLTYFFAHRLGLYREDLQLPIW